MAGIFELPGASGQTIEDPNGPLWYSPVQITNPDWTKHVRDTLEQVSGILGPLTTIQKTTVDVFAPILDSVNRKADLFETALKFVKEFLISMLDEIGSILTRSGIYVLITIPEFNLKRYVWVPAKRVLNQRSAEELDPIATVGINNNGDLSGLEIGGGPRARISVDNDGGFFSINEKQYSEFLKGKSIKLGTGSGTQVEINRKISTVFFSIGSEGIGGFIDKFRESFIPKGNTRAGASKTGERSDLCIPNFTEGDVVTGLSIMVSAPGFNNFFDSFFRVLNIFVPGNSLRRAFRDILPDLTTEGNAVDALKRTRLALTFEEPYLEWKQDTGPKPGSKRKEIREAIDFKDSDRDFQITFKTRPLRRLRGWRVTYWLKVTQIETDEGQENSFNYRDAPIATDKDVSRFMVGGFHKIATLYSENLLGDTELPEFTQGKTVENEILYKAAAGSSETDGVRIVNDTGSNNTGIKFPIPESHFDATYNWIVTLEGLYNRKWTPTSLIGESVVEMTTKYKELANLIPQGKLVANQSAADIIAEKDTRSFDDLGGTSVQTKILNKFKSDKFGTLRTIATSTSDEVISILSSEYAITVNDVARTFLSKLGYERTLANSEEYEKRQQQVAQEIYLQMKYKPNPRGNFYSDELDGSDLYDFVEERTKKHVDKRSQIEIEDGWQTIHMMPKLGKVPTPAAEGSRSFLSKIKFGTLGPVRANQAGFGIPDFRLNRWFCVNVDAYWPSLREFLDRFKRFAKGFDITFPELKSPYLDFVNGLLDELNKLIARINQILETLNAIIETVSLLSGEGLHVIRIEDELGKGYTTGGNSQIQNIVLNSPGLPEYLRDEASGIVRAANIGATGVVGRQNRPAYFNTENATATFPDTENIALSQKRDDFVASITLLAGAPVFENAFDKYKQTVSDEIKRIKDFNPDLFIKREQSVAKLTKILAQLSLTEIRRNTLKATLESAEEQGLTPEDVASIQAQVNNLEAELTSLQTSRKAEEDKIAEIDQALSDLVGGQGISSVDKDAVTAAEIRQAKILGAPFNFIERTIFGTNRQEKIDQATALGQSEGSIAT